MKQKIRIIAQENALTFARIKKGMERSDLAKSVGLSTAQIFYIEKGKATTARSASKIAKALNLEFDDLFEVIHGVKIDD